MRHSACLRARNLRQRKYGSVEARDKGPVDNDARRPPILVTSDSAVRSNNLSRTSPPDVLEHCKEPHL
ncbi:hypothetical protein GCM10011583_47730 [Streptomyces camponoticapitis]|uniref:Transposase n=1 Tax=Streptomyces camponoticapitis TaxID=1616125 RepID=A0ABQ2EFS3_9ACTN|nr:hypothetical protein GCM10011583_47730 [Streptomyces camponoticapitis]